VQPELDAKVAVASALAEVLPCSAIEAARLIAQAESELLQQALQAVPIDADRVLVAISRGAYARSREQLTSDDTDARRTAARAFPTPASGVVTAAMEQRRAGRVRMLFNKLSEHARNAHARALEIERDALAIIQGLKNRRTRGADNTELVEALGRALIKPPYDFNGAIANATEELDREVAPPEDDLDRAVADLNDPALDPTEPWTLG
jgi:hypothetical protein